MALATNKKYGEGVKLLNEYRLDPNEVDVHFGLEGPAKPWKKVAMAACLLTLGSILLFTGVGLFVNGMQNAIPLMVIGSLAFIPGAYFTRIAYMAWKGYRGYSLASIPDL